MNATILRVEHLMMHFGGITAQEKRPSLTA